MMVKIMSDFEKEFSDLISQKRDGMKQEYNRVLPTGELIFNRFDKAKYLNAGKNSSVYDTSVIMGDVVIGDNVWIGPYTLIESINGKVTIGDFVSINAGSYIYTHDSTKYYLSGGVDDFEKGDVTIGCNTVIGSMSIICYGVNIGTHCVVASNSMVNEDVPDYTVVAGNPAEKIGEVVINDSGSVSYVYNRSK